MGGMCFALAGSAVPLWRKSTFLGQQPTSHSSLHRARERPKRGSTATVRAFQVTFQTPDGDQKFECDGAQKCIYKEGTYLLDAADENGLDMPYSCRAGTCATCLGKMVSGEVDQSEGTALEDSQVEDGMVLTCISYPRSDITIQSHQNPDL